MPRLSDNPRTEVFGLRLTPLDRARIDFWSKLKGKASATVAAELLSQAIASAIHQDTAPKAVNFTDDTADASPDRETAAA